MDVVQTDVFLLVVTSGGIGEITPIVDYPGQHCAGSGDKLEKTCSDSFLFILIIMRNIDMPTTCNLFV